jgi:hypothetical protein
MTIFHGVQICCTMKLNSTDTNNTGDTSASNTRPVPPKARELLQDRNGILPLWFRSPKSGTEFYTGFSRAKLYELAGKGLIRSVSIREKNAVKGTRLFNMESTLSYIEKCEREAAKQGTVNA